MSMLYLNKDQVLQMHVEVCGLLGLSDEVRNEVALGQALHFPESTFNGNLVHSDVPSAAAAYVWHLVQNHPFESANGAVAGLASYVFAVSNGYQWKIENDTLVKLIEAAADSLLSKQELVAFFREVLIQE